MSVRLKKWKENFKKSPIILRLLCIIIILSFILRIISGTYGMKLPISNSILESITWASFGIWCIGYLIWQAKLE